MLINCRCPLIIPAISLLIFTAVLRHKMDNIKWCSYASLTHPAPRIPGHHMRASSWQCTWLQRGLSCWAASASGNINASISSSSCKRGRLLWWKVHFLPYFVCHPAGQTGVTGDKGQTGENGITGDAGEFEETPYSLFQETVNSLHEQICISSSVFARTNKTSR